MSSIASAYRTQIAVDAEMADNRLFGKNFQDEMDDINAEYEDQRKRTLESLERTRKLLGINS